MSSYMQSWQALNRLQFLAVAVLGCAVVLANIHQPYPTVAPLQHIPTVVLIFAAPALIRRWPLSNASVMAIVAFFLLHTLAGRYTYSNVPYDDWARLVFGRDISTTFGLTRNGFDRVVHFSFGFLWVFPFAEAMRRYGGVRRNVSLWMAFLFVGAVSALYEVLEWLLTIILSPGMADEYNGQQGDVWDSQKDMATAMVGAAISMVLSRFSRGFADDAS
jgi:putative membrane protein